MQRRKFLGAAIKAGLGAGVVSSTAVNASGQSSDIHAALGTTQLRKPEITVITYNFPSWHPSPYMEARFGKGWTEFETLRNARPQFPGHSMPHYPLWGYYDEADPAWAAKEIDLAAAHGVDAWLIDWYWHEGAQFYQEQLEQGFLKAENRGKLKFAVMWANHDWKNVYPARSPNEAAVLLPQIHTQADCVRVIEYCAQHYFSQPNYLRIDDAPLFCFFDAGKLVEQLHPDGVKRALTRMRERALQLGFPRLHFQVANGYDGYQSQLKDFGFDSATQYGNFGWTYGSKPPGSRIPYGVGALEAIESWKQKQAAATVPFHPCVSVGWDDSPRFEAYACVAINRSPDQFERLLRAARHAVAEASHPRLVYVAAWNEWTEDHVLLPDTYWGYSYLEALRRAAHD
jgi:hypothetical protein